MILHLDLREFLGFLNSEKSEFLIVGAHALAHYATPRYTGDLDIFARISAANADAILRAMSQFGLGDIGVTRAMLLEANTVIQLGRPPNRIDILTGLTGVSFEDAWPNRVQGMLDGVPVAYLGREDLIANKRALGRAKDLADIEAIEKGRK